MAGQAAIILAAALFVSGQAHSGDAGEGIAVAKRLVSAIKGKADFRDSDFVKTLGESDKAALRQFAPCKVSRINYQLSPHPTQSNALVRDPNSVGVGFECKGVPFRTPVAISLELESGRIAKIETHNADLMRRD